MARVRRQPRPAVATGRLLAESKQPELPMRTPYLRNDPDEDAERLERLASQAGLPLSIFAVRELSETSRRGNAASQLAALPDLAVPVDAIVSALSSERDAR